MSTSLDPFMKLIKNIEELENEFSSENERKVFPNKDQILELPVCVFLESIILC